MKKIFSLTKVFVKEFYQNFNVFDKEKKKFNKKSLLFWLIAIVFLGVSYVSYEVISFLIDAGQPDIFLNIYFLILTILLLFQTVLVCGNILFFSEDIEKVLHMPVKPVELLLAKFNTLVCMLYASEAILGVVPITLYGLLTNVQFIFYFWEILVLLIFPIFLAIFISVFMMLLMRFAKFIRNKEAFQFITTIIMMVLLCFFEAKMFAGLLTIQNEEQAVQQATNFSQKAEEVGKYFLIINPSVNILLNYLNVTSIISFVKLLIYNLVGMIIFLMIGKFTYLKDILRNMVNKTKRKRRTINIKEDTKSHSIRRAYIMKELKLLLREPIFFMQCVFPVIMILFTCIVLVVFIVPIVLQIVQDPTIKEKIGNLSFDTEVICDILIVIQVLFSISNISLTAISREGKSAVFAKYIPIELYKQFVYKNVPQIILNFLVSIVVLGIIWYFVPSINIIYLAIILVTSIFISLINSYLMLIVDLKRPNIDWDTAYVVVKKSDNKFFQYAFMIINVLFLMYIAKVLENVNIVLALILQMIIYGVLFIIIDRCVKKWQIKLFNKII